MTVKKRLIPKLLVKFRQSRYTKTLNPVLVLSKKFNDYIYIGDPISQAKIFESLMADEIILINLEADDYFRQPFLDLLSKFQNELSTPLTVGGSIKSLSDIEMFLHHGADKVILNTSLLLKNSLIKQLANTFGSQCISVAIDYKKADDANFQLFHSSGQIHAQVNPCDWAKQCEEEGAGELVLSSIDNDGSLDGYDLNLLKLISQCVDLPIVISGGCGSVNDFLTAFTHGVSGASASSFFFKRDFNLMQCRSFLKTSGINVRSDIS